VINSHLLYQLSYVGTCKRRVIMFVSLPLSSGNLSFSRRQRTACYRRRVRIDYHGRRFRSVATSGGGDVDDATLFTYEQRGDIVTASYAGGSVVLGSLLALVAADGSLDMRYHHVSRAGALMTGVCRSTLEILADGRYRLHESWQWTCGDHARGHSVIEEVAP